ncbi:hypothetical protein Taro_044532 [Colocasia esculenta]|uniref:Serine/threonine-protein phosphatase 2A activator n=1 Tax=Colocasia esculenta TaxID=4460 RepID=A0A843WUA6_COLES|nr:hypothetical protein [Colocasia esculenta]
MATPEMADTEPTSPEQPNCAAAESSPTTTCTGSHGASPSLRTIPSPTLCCACASASASASATTTSCPPSLQPPPWNPTSASPPPVYRPIRAPAINAPNHNQTAIILSPVPQPLPVDVLPLPHRFEVPAKRITSPADIDHFHSSASGKGFLGFVAGLSQAVLLKKISDPLPVPLSGTLESLLNLLDTLSRWADEIPPLPHPGRYGNPAFRLWHERLENFAEQLVLDLLPDGDIKPAATVELVPYLLDSFGNSTRIDYGTGHETNFAAFLYCLARLGLIKEEDYQGLVLKVFVKYLELLRKLQMVYSLEPAGSHGVWGLDDYHFLPFIFGSAQLVDHKYMKPKSIHNQDILDNFSGEYMYLGCIAFVKKVKKGLFAEHSPMLDDISGVAHWAKVNSGMLKMYKAEVLEKVPIMQHFLFGSIIKWFSSKNQVQMANQTASPGTIN